jgi:hypothetical protein
MMPEDSRTVDAKPSGEASGETGATGAGAETAQVDGVSDDDEPESAATGSLDVSTTSGSKKKKPKRKRTKKTQAQGEGNEAKVTGLSKEEMLEANPSLPSDVRALEPDKSKGMQNELSIADMITGLVGFLSHKHGTVIAKLTPRFCIRHLPERTKRTWLVMLSGRPNQCPALVYSSPQNVKLLRACGGFSGF